MDNMVVKFPNEEMIGMEYGKPVVVVGANGSGKTRFSVQIEEMNDPAFNSNHVSESHIHRLSAQKSLEIETTIPIYDIESSERNLFLGNSEAYANKNDFRYRQHPITHLLHDYQSALSLLFAKSQRELQIEHEKSMECSKNGTSIPAPSETLVDRAQKIWNSLLPHRIIDLSGNGVSVHFHEQKYHGKEMSDGERVILYMICQALVVKPNTLLIIDEPELHIHKAIVAELWTILEKERPDCIFMYLTHDIDFARTRYDAQYIWIKSFDGNSWKYEFIDPDSFPDIPSDLLLEIVGTRQKILFVEGTKDSYDYKLYQEIYREKGYRVIPCGGCQEVIKFVKAKKAYESLNSVEVYGIIDRDFRNPNEIEALKKDGIFALGVAEVENLFVAPELLEIMEQQLACDDGTAERAKQFIEKLFNDCKENQIANALSKEITHQLSLFELGGKMHADEEIHKLISDRFTIQRITEWHVEKRTIYDSATSLPEILAIFNFKELPLKVSSIYSLADREYPKRVLNILSRNDEVRDKVISAFASYVPQLP